MFGNGSFCIDESSFNAPVARTSGQQGALNLALRSNEVDNLVNLLLTNNSIREQDITKLAVLQKYHKVVSLPSIPSMRESTGLSSSCVSSNTAVCAGNVNFALNTSPVTAEDVWRSAESALSVVPFSAPVNPENVCDNAELAHSCSLWSSPVSVRSRHGTGPSSLYRQDPEQGRSNVSMLNYPYRQPNMAGFSLSSNMHRYVHDPGFLTQPDNAHQAPDASRLDNRSSHVRATGELSLPASVPRYGAKNGAKNKQDTEGLPLPESLARSFDSSEIDKIAKAIVRVNEFRSSTATDSTLASSEFQVVSARPSTHGMPSFVQESYDGRGTSNLKNPSPRVLPSVGAFTVQCAKCFKWRLIPSKEQYEQIRRHILEKPFFCTTSALWQPGASCEDPPELCEDAKFVWAIDKPNIPLAPSGWERLLVIRSEGCSKFADIYYVSPSGKKLRSMPDIERYLSEHPELVNEGVNLSQFSFGIPRALNENYCRKKPLGSSTSMRGSITHKSTATSNLGVRSQPLKVSYLRRSPAEYHDHMESGTLECRQPRADQSSENAPLAIEPLRSWHPDCHVPLLGYQAGVTLQSPANTG